MINAYLKFLNDTYAVGLVVYKVVEYTRAERCLFSIGLQVHSSSKCNLGSLSLLFFYRHCARITGYTVIPAS